MIVRISENNGSPVLLQAMREDPPPDARCRDKFLVQSIAITSERDLGGTTAIVSHNSEKPWRCTNELAVAEC